MATIAQSRQRGGGCLGVVVVLAIIGAVIGMIALSNAVPKPSQPPAIKDIIPRSHAVETHGQDAIDARAALAGCKSIQTKWVRKGVYGPGWAIWCETGLIKCPGMFVTAGGIEKTVFPRNCTEWRNLR